MKDIRNVAQERFILMHLDDNGNKYWRLNYNIQEKKDSENNSYFECDFVPENGGILADEPTLSLFIEELKLKGLSDTEIDII